MSIAARAARNFSTQAAALVVVLLERVVLTGVLIRSWGVDTYSDWATLLAATGLLVIGDFGFQTYLGTMLSRARVRERTRTLQRLAALGLFFYLCTALALLLLVVGIVWFGDVRALLNLHGANLGIVFLVLGIQQTLRVSRSAFVQLYRGMGEYYLLTWADVRTLGTAMAAAAAAAALGAQPLLVALLYLAVELVVGLGLTAYDIRRRYGFRLRGRLPSRRTLVRTAGALKWYGLFQTLSYSLQNIPVLIIAWLGLGGPGLVMFVVQRTLVNVARTVGNNLSIAVGVELAAVSETSERRGYQTGVRALAGINAALAGLMASGLLAFGNEIVQVWTGRAELGSLTLLLLLLLPIVALAPATPLYMLSHYTDRLRPQAIATGIRAVITIGGAVLLGSEFGVVGVAGALAAGEIVGMAIVAPWLTSRALDIDYPRLVLRAAAVFAAALVWSGAVAAAVLAAVDFGGLLGFLLRLTAWGAVAGVPVLWIALPPPARRHALELFRRGR